MYVDSCAQDARCSRSRYIRLRIERISFFLPSSLLLAKTGLVSVTRIRRAGVFLGAGGAATYEE